jgi:phenylpropionate dioxygenase-like ring-hydroxylating dioxygenase large terminal subunit
MDRAWVERFKERSAWEAARTGPPDGFPQLPDLPLGRYTNPEFYELEREHLWRKSWVFAAHDSELREIGSYRLVDVAGAPVLLVRGDDGVVRAFYNSCRHRGAPVVRGSEGCARLLTCQFHGWSYNLQGDLARVPEERDFVGLDRSTRGLPPVRCEAFGGFHFVNLDPAASSLAEWLGPVNSILHDVAHAPLRLLDRKSASVRCNWKILAEGFLEVYHARTIHPTTVAPSLDTRGTVISLYPGGHQSMVSPVTVRADGREALRYFDGAPPGMTEVASNPAFGIFPNLITPLDGRGFPLLVFWPEAIDRTRLDIIWYVSDFGEDEIPHMDVWQRRLDRFDMLMDEDYLNLEPIQRSMEHAAHGGQVINYQERRIFHVHAWIDKMIGESRIPPDLHVPDTLAAWVELD